MLFSFLFCLFCANILQRPYCNLQPPCSSSFYSKAQASSSTKFSSYTLNTIEKIVQGYLNKTCIECVRLLKPSSINCCKSQNKKNSSSCQSCSKGQKTYLSLIKYFNSSKIENLRVLISKLYKRNIFAIESNSNIITSKAYVLNKSVKAAIQKYYNSKKFSCASFVKGSTYLLYSSSSSKATKNLLRSILKKLKTFNYNFFNAIVCSLSCFLLYFTNILLAGYCSRC